MIDRIQLSLDAYYYIKDGEEPIDPDNLEEADEILHKYKNGIIFIGEPEPIKGTDMVETMISIIQKTIISKRYLITYALTSDKSVYISVGDLQECKMRGLFTTKKLEAIGNKYWAEYLDDIMSGEHHLLPICSIAEYDKWFQ